MDIKKIDSAIRILHLAEKQAEQYAEPVEIAYSGGKDSDVILQLAKESGIKYRAIYKNTTIDPVGTIQHCRANGVEIRQPKESFFTLIKKHGLPSFRFRFCCQHLKEYKILNTAVWGVRADESIARKNGIRLLSSAACIARNQKSTFTRQYMIGRCKTLRILSPTANCNLHHTIIMLTEQSTLNAVLVAKAVSCRRTEASPILRQIPHYYARQFAQ